MILEISVTFIGKIIWAVVAVFVNGILSVWLADKVESLTQSVWQTSPGPLSTLVFVLCWLFSSYFAIAMIFGFLTISFVR